MLTQMLKRAAQTRPEQTAIVQGPRRISYAQLYGMAAAAGEGLRELGVTATGCVAVILPNCPEFIISLFACARIGAVLSPLNPHYTKDELLRFLQDGEVQVIITDALRQPVCRDISTELAGSVHLVVVGEPEFEAIGFDDLLIETPLVETELRRTAPALYLYTSGSTSAYKRVCCTQENLYYEAHNFVETLGLSADDAILCSVPLYHSYGFGNGLLDAAYAGSTLVLLAPVHDENGRLVDPPFISRTQHVLELMQQEGIRFFPGVPYQFKALADLPDYARIDLSGLKWCISSGDVLPKATYQSFLQRFGIAIRSLYGSTEAGSICLNTDADIGMAGFGSLGLPLRNVEIQIRDEAGRIAPDGVSGAIWVKSPVIPPNGYDNRSELNPQVFRDGYYDTGDVGQKAENGHLVITGRKQTFVDVGGYKVDIGELEEALLAHPQVREAAALAVELPHAGLVLKAVIVSQGSLETHEVLDFCRERLAAYKVPALIEFRKELPRSPLGKVLKNELKSTQQGLDFDMPALALPVLTDLNHAKQIETVAARLQEQVAATLRLDQDLISSTASFQSLGFDSIRAAELHSRLLQLTGLQLSITLMWNHPSIAELAEVLVEKLQALSEPVSVMVDRKANAILGAAEQYASPEQILNWIDGLTEIEVDVFFQLQAHSNSANMES
jgi:long-chain acyl-CoA synthetase